MDKRPPTDSSVKPWQPTRDGTRVASKIGFENPTEPRQGWQPFEFNGQSFMVDARGFNPIEGTLNGWTWNSVPAGVVVSDGDVVLVSRDGTLAAVIGDDGFRAVLRGGTWRSKDPATLGDNWVDPDATRASALSSAARKALSLTPPTSDPNPESVDYEATFPPGTRFFDVEGIPVAWSPLPDGGMRLGAYDPELRFFPMSSVERNGMEVDAAAFDRLRAKSVTEPTFADRLRFFDVEGTPVAIVPTPDGGFDVRAFDGPESRRFSLSSVLRNGGEVDKAAFDRLKAKFQADS